MLTVLVTSGSANLMTTKNVQCQYLLIQNIYIVAVPALDFIPIEKKQNFMLPQIMGRRISFSKHFPFEASQK